MCRFLKASINSICLAMFWTFFLLFWVNWSAAQAYDVSLTCPKTWTDGQQVILTCRINASRWTEEICALGTDAAEFKFSMNGLPESPECAVRNFRETCEDTGSACTCLYLRDGMYVLQYGLTASQNKHEGGNWSCYVPCTDSSLRPHLTLHASEGCSSVKFRSDTSGSAKIQTSASLCMILLVYLPTMPFFSRRLH